MRDSGIFCSIISNISGRMALRRSPDIVVIDGRIEEAASKRHLRGVSAHRDRVRQQAEPSCLIFFFGPFQLDCPEQIRDNSESGQEYTRYRIFRLWTRSANRRHFRTTSSRAASRSHQYGSLPCSTTERLVLTA